MVLVIKSSGNTTADAHLIATQMINIETNQLVYDPTGSFLNVQTKRDPFNVYVHQSVEFEFQVTFGVVVIYTESGDDISSIIGNVITRLGVPESFKETIDPITDHYTLVTAPIRGFSTIIGAKSSQTSCFRKLITDPYYIKRVMSSGGADFVWLIVQKTSRNFRGAHLRVAEVDPSYLSESYLNRSVCTILYDGMNMFDILTMSKQLNYPSLYQYNMFKNTRIVQDPIHVSWTLGMHAEIYYQFTKTPLTSESLRPYPIFGTPASFEEVKLKRLDPTRPCWQQLTDPFDYEAQELAENELLEEGKPRYPNDVCFITRIPLWGTFLVGTIKTGDQECDIAISPSFLFCKDTTRRNEGDMDALIASQSKGMSTLVTLRTCIHPRTFVEVLDMMDIAPVKKNIMRCMELYGAYATPDNLGIAVDGVPRYASRIARQYYVCDKLTNQIFVGVTGMTDAHIAMYQNTRTTLFRVINVEICTSPDPILFQDHSYDPQTR